MGWGRPRSEARASSHRDPNPRDGRFPSPASRWYNAEYVRLTSSELGRRRGVIDHPASPAVRLVAIRHRGRPRTLALLAPPERAAYARLGAAVAPSVEDALGPRVMANRVAASSLEPPALTLRSWRMERRLFARGLEALASNHRCAAIADVHACYASITPATARAALRRVGAADPGRVEAFLGQLQGAGVRGLPVGPNASAVIANAVLAPVDEALEGGGIAHLRWVDDFVLGAPDVRTARRALEIVRHVLEGLGLRLCDRKTLVLPDAGDVVRAGTRSQRSPGIVG